MIRNRRGAIDSKSPFKKETRVSFAKEPSNKPKKLPRYDKEGNLID